MSSWASREGSPTPLGVAWIEAEAAFNFAIYSKHAEAVTLQLFKGDFTQPVLSHTFDHRINKTGRIWHCRLPAERVAGARYYGYRLDGPEPAGRFEWHMFDPDKLLLDPYARAVFFPPGFERKAALAPGLNTGKAPLGVLPASRPAAATAARPSAPRHEADTIIYELHVRAFTVHASSGIPAERRGTYAGLVEALPYLRDLGITAVELMPVFQYDPQGCDRWGYMPISFFAPHGGYASCGPRCEQVREFRSMVDAIHDAGIEVILDVVYNHTGEGDHTGPTYSFKGIDASSYYLMSGRSADPYCNFAGTGNSINCQNRHVRAMILDSLRYWATEMNVDGFRFDLASVFTRNADGSINWEDPPIIGELSSDPVLSGLRLIGEPWDAQGAYQLGRSFPGITWQQWNGRFRDDVRRFVRGDEGMVPALMYRLYGSDDLFPDTRMDAYHPYQSINYVTAHDGFTLYDLVAYNDRHNWANGHDNADGPADNYSWNCGWEGDEGASSDVLALRRRQAKNLACLLFLANGTPMFRAGDEMLNTQGGNSNPYNQDNDAFWLRWEQRQANADMVRFFKGLIAFRKAHPSLSRSRFWRDDVRWYGEHSRQVDLAPAAHHLAYCLHGASEADVDIYVMINGAAQPCDFVIQEWQSGRWCVAVDTAAQPPEDIPDPGGRPDVDSPVVRLDGRSIVVLVARQR